MNNSTMFKQAHAMTKQVIKSGDNYQVTFGLCLKAIKAELVAAAQNNVNFTMIAVIVMFITNTVNKAVKKGATILKATFYVFLAFLVNPFSYIIANDVYLRMMGL